MNEDPPKKRNLKAKSGTSSRVSERQSGAVAEEVPITYLDRPTKDLSKGGMGGRCNSADTN